MRRILLCPRCGKETAADFVREWVYHRCDHCPMILDREQHVKMEVDDGRGQADSYRNE